MMQEEFTPRDLIAGSTLAIVEDAGRSPTLERPDAVHRALEDWLGL